MHVDNRTARGGEQMAYAIAPDPTVYDPPGTCEHLDCRATWAFYETPCTLCGAGFQPGDRWMRDEDAAPAHMGCVLRGED
jgi:hypothetical protein